jgi:hypothetical protein
VFFFFYALVLIKFLLRSESSIVLFSSVLLWVFFLQHIAPKLTTIAKARPTVKHPAE